MGNRISGPEFGRSRGGIMAKDKYQQQLDKEMRQAKQERVIKDLNSITWVGGIADLEYIQRKHRVPAYKGVHVRTSRFPDEEGIITGADGDYLVVRYPRMPVTRILHPTNVEFLGVAYVKREDQEGEA
jgi:hypothetical protein